MTRSILASVLAHVNVAGNFVPESWYSYLREDMARGPKVDLVAITLLSEVFWHYRPIEVRNDKGRTSHVLKFSGPCPSFSYTAFENKFGITRNQARDALRRLESRHLIHRLPANGPDNEGTKLYIWLNLHEVVNITTGLYIPSDLLALLPASFPAFVASMAENPPSFWSALYPELMQSLGITALVSHVSDSMQAPRAGRAGGGGCEFTTPPFVNSQPPTVYIKSIPQIEEKPPLPPKNGTPDQTPGDNCEGGRNLDGGRGDDDPLQRERAAMVALLMDEEVGIRSRQVALTLADNFKSVEDVYPLIEEWLFDPHARHIGSLLYRLRNPDSYAGHPLERADTTLTLWHRHIFPRLSEDVKARFFALNESALNESGLNEEEKNEEEEKEEQQRNAETPERVHVFPLQPTDHYYTLLQQIARDLAINHQEFQMLQRTTKVVRAAAVLHLYLPDYTYWQSWCVDDPDKFEQVCTRYGLQDILFHDPRDQEGLDP